MFARLVSLMQLRQSTAFLLTRADDRLLDDIGLSRAELEAMRLGASHQHALARATAFPAVRANPVAV